MPSLEIHKENKAIHYLFPIQISPSDKDPNSLSAYMDATKIVIDAINRDKKNGYKSQNGPHYGIEVNRAIEYSNYVQAHANSDNFRKFSTSKYTIFEDLSQGK